MHTEYRSITYPSRVSHHLNEIIARIDCSFDICDPEHVDPFEASENSLTWNLKMATSFDNYIDQQRAASFENKIMHINCLKCH